MIFEQRSYSLPWQRATGSEHRQFVVVERLKCPAIAHPDDSRTRSDDRCDVVTAQALRLREGCHPDIAKAVDPLWRSHPDIAFTIFIETIYRIAGESLSLAKMIDACAVEVVNPAFLCRDPQPFIAVQEHRRDIQSGPAQPGHIIWHPVTGYEPLKSQTRSTLPHADHQRAIRLNS